MMRQYVKTKINTPEHSSYYRLTFPRHAGLVFLHTDGSLAHDQDYAICAVNIHPRLAGLVFLHTDGSLEHGQDCAICTVNIEKLLSKNDR